MPIETATAETFDELLSDNDIILLDFWADWCGPCHQFAPIFEEASERHDDVCFAKVDVDEQQQLAGEFGVQSIPTVVAIRDRVVLFSQPGVLPGEGVDQVLGQIRELDMETIRAEIAQDASGT
jgi:thioredoxin 1